MPEPFSRRDFLRLAVASPFLFAGIRLDLDTIYKDHLFRSKLQILKENVDKNPNSDIPKLAYSAFVQSHIAAAGAEIQGRKLAASNLMYYIYGGGKPRNITREYSQIAAEAEGGVSTFLGDEISAGLNDSLHIKSPFVDRVVVAKHRGFNLKRQKLPEWSNLKVLVDPDYNSDLNLALGRHTLNASLSVVSQNQNIDLNTLSQGMNSLVSEFVQTGVKFRIDRYMTQTQKPITLVDTYKFNSEANQYASGAGNETTDMTVKKTFSFLDKFVDRDKLRFYMGWGYDNLTKGKVEIDQIGLSELVKLDVAHPYQISASFDNIRQLPIDILVRE